MNDKKADIIQAAIKLFGERDYHATSVQDIVSLAGISKGAFYLHFHSKDQLLVDIFGHYMDLLNSHMAETQSDLSLNPRKKLYKAIEFQCELIMKEYLSLQLLSIATLNESIQELMVQHSKHVASWTDQRICELYGPEIAPHSFDCAIMLNAMLKEYYFCYFVYQHPFDSKQLAEYLVNRLDDIAYGVISKPTVPILSKTFILSDDNPEKTKESWIERTLTVREWIESHIETPLARETMLQSLDVIVQEVNKEQPNCIIIKGMYNYLVSLSEGDTAMIEQLKQFLDIHT
jgi:AcrR family transcriptional regulator